VNSIQLYVSKPIVNFLFTFISCPLLITSVLFNIYTEIKNITWNIKELVTEERCCQPCLPSILAGFVWDTISGMTMGLPFHYRDPADALTSCMKECLRKAWKFCPHYTNSVKQKKQALKFEKYHLRASQRFPI
jgi:hypothetical protein